MVLILGAMVMAWLIMEAPQALNDAYVARRAAKAGEWDFLNGHEARRDARSAARAARRQVWAERIFNRNKAKADGEPKRAGLGTLAGDVYHGACEDALAKRAVRRQARPPFDPAKPTVTQRAVDLLKAKVRGQRDERGDTRPLPDDELVPAQPTDRMPCPRCRQTMTRSQTGWTHPGGNGCTGATQPGRGVVHPCDGTYCTGCPTCRPPKFGWRCDNCGRSHEGFGCPTAARDDADATPCTPTIPEPTMTDADREADENAAYPATPVPNWVADAMYGYDTAAHQRDLETRHGPTVFGDNPHHYPLPQPAPGGTIMTAPTVAEVHTNEALRQAAGDMKAGAAKLAEAASQAEAARAQMAAAAQAASDAVSATSFDGGATAASHAASDAAGAVSDTTISQWCEKSDAVAGAADQVLASLEKYRDSEDLVASERIDARVLEPSAS